MGEEEYERVRANFDRLVVLKSNGEIEQIRYECDKALHNMEDQCNRNIENEVNQGIASQTRDMERRHKEELAEKDTHHAQDLEDKINLRISANEEKHQQKNKEVEITLQRLESQNKQLADQVDKQQKIIESKSSELRGTAGEGSLLDNLHNAFPKDELAPKIVGVAMADVIQTVVENGEKIAPPIVWDRKTSDKVTPSDICKAKIYRTTHNTDYSIIVTENGITRKDSNNTSFGEREGIFLLHPTAVIEIARLFRSFIIDKAKQTSSNKDRTSKQAKLYEYLKSSEYARTIETTRNAKMKLDDLQRKEEEYHKTTWNNRKNLIDEWRIIGEKNQQKINDIMQDQTSEDSKDDSNKKEEDYSSSKHRL